MKQQGPARGAKWWYYVITVATFGLFAWVPFLLAAIRFKTAYTRSLTTAFGLVNVLTYVLTIIAPTDGNGDLADPWAAMIGLLAIGSVVAGCAFLASLREPVTPPPPREPDVDPAIKTALDARARRAESRKLATTDPLLARELCIGRPDLLHEYDDGGLVDLNSAPASVVAEVCAIPPEVAETVAATCAAQSFTSVDELFVMAEIPVNTWDRIRDRAVFVG